MCPGLFIHILNKIDERHVLSVSGYWYALLEFNLDISGLVILEVDILECFLGWLKICIFNVAAFNRPTPKVEVYAVLLGLRAYWDVLLLCKLYFHVSSQIHVPDGCDDL